MAEQHQLDSELDDLLGGVEDLDEEEKKKRGRERDNHSRMVTPSASKDLLTHQTAPDNRQNVSGRENVSDLDDMDASLFGNFSHSQNKRAVGRSNTQSSSHGAGKKELSDHRSFMGNTGSVTESQMNIKDTDGTKKSTVTVKNVPEKHTATELDDDDLFNLLTENKEELMSSSQPKTRPKFHMKPLSPRQKSSKVLSDPAPLLKLQTSGDGQPHAKSVEIIPTEESENRPKSGKGLTQLSEKKPLETTTPSGGKSALSLDNIAGSGVARKATSAGEKETHVESGFDVYDTDDLLSGMGFNTTGISHTPRSFGLLSEKLPSRLSDSPHETGDETTKEMMVSIRSDTKRGKGMVDKNDEVEDEESYMFGGYMPSVASGSRQPTKETVQPTKKSVRFAESEPSGINTSYQSEPERPHSPVMTTLRGRGVTREVEETEAVDKEVTNLLQVQVEAPSHEHNGDLKQDISASKLEHPVFPWQQRKKRDLGLVANRSSSNPLHAHNRATDNDISKPEPKEERAEESVGMSSVKNSLAERLSIREPWEEVRVEIGTRFQSKPQQAPINMVSEERRQPEDLKAKVASLGHQLEVSEQQQQLLSERLKTVEDEKMELQSRFRSKELELTSQLEELRAELQRVESERDQLHQSVETMKTHRAEEQAAMDKSHSARIQELEESFHRREERWKEELEGEASHWKERLETSEREKIDAILALKKKMESLEIAKANEIAKLQETHRSAVSDMKREHELDLQRMKESHRQEVEALRAAHSHTQRLLELSGVVEAAARGVSALQSRVEQAHREGLELGQQNNQAHLQHLRTLEERLSKEYRDMESERELLRSLASRLESQLSQQSQAVEQEKWQLQQERTKLRAGERALEEERASSLARLDQERRDLTKSKERFLAEQQKLLSECLSERHSLASERAQLTVQQKKMTESENRNAQRRHAMESELEVSLAKAAEEQAQLASEAAHLQWEESRLKTESLRVEHEREVVERARASLMEQMSRVGHREEEANNLNQSARALYKEAEEKMQAAQKVQADLAHQAEAVKKDLLEMEQREAQLASERLNLARETRELRSRELQLQFSPCSSSNSLHCDPNPLLASAQRLDSSITHPLPDTSALTHSLPLPNNSVHQQIQAGSNDHSPVLSPSLQHSRRSRTMA